MRRRRVVFLVSSLQAGGAERHTVQLLNRLDRARIDATLCALESGGVLGSQLDRRRLSGVHFLGKSRSIDLGVVARLWAIVAETTPDTVVCVDLYPSIYAHALRLARGARFRIVQIVHCTRMLGRYNEGVTRFIYVPLLKRSDHIVFVCKNQMDYWTGRHRLPPRSCSYIYNGVDVEHFARPFPEEALAALRARLGITRADKVICAVAGLRREKRLTDLVDAGTILRAKGMPAKLLLVGDGAERAALAAHVRERGMSDRVVMAGFQADVRPFLQLADAVALSSTMETFPLAVLEAMAAGKPVVAPAVGGVPEQVVDGVTGALFPTGDVRGMAAALERTITDSAADGTGDRCRGLVRERFTVARMVSEYERLLLQ